MPDRKKLALRSMKAPGTAYHFPELDAIGKEKQVGHMKDFKVLSNEYDAGGVHVSSMTQPSILSGCMRKKGPGKYRGLLSMT